MTLKAILVIGPSYCGKSYFIDTVINQKAWCKVIYVGDLCRAKSKKIGRALNHVYEASEIAEIVGAVLENEPNETGVWIIDNLFKTKEGIKAIDLLHLDDVIVYLVKDVRTKVDFSSRGREDDQYIQAKREIWASEEAGILEELDRRDLVVRTVLNTDNGFLITGCD